MALAPLAICKSVRAKQETHDCPSGQQLALFSWGEVQLNIWDAPKVFSRELCVNSPAFKKRPTVATSSCST